MALMALLIVKSKSRSLQLASGDDRSGSKR